MKKKEKPIFIIAVLLIVMVGLMFYVQKHGTVNTVGSNVELSAGQAILIDGNTGKLLYEKNADEKTYPASTTKIMTALLTLETLEKYESPINQRVYVPDEAVGVEGSSIYLKQRERISIEDLLYGLMLVSGNDAATALACIISGSENRFVEKMNNRARSLGCRETHFQNPSGLFDENHYTTARDMSKIACEAMKNKSFRKLVAAKDWQTTRTNDSLQHFHNKNKTIYEYAGGNGIKIGYTENSGRTLVASAKKKNRELICVVMSAPDWFNDAYRLMDYGFSKQ